VRIGAKSIARRLARRSRNIRLVAPDSRELRELYAWADMIVIPLKPNLHVSGITVVAEAVLFGVPMVCTDTGGLRAYFSDDEVRYVPANDPGAMRSAIEQLAANDALRFEMTSKAQERLLKTELSTRARARRLSDLSRDLLRAPPIGKDAEGQSEDAYINV
jgi:glycosyltransferase involved in cell wall biosynthesis